MISIRINLDDIDESRIYTGKKGRYLNAFLRETPDNKYGNDYMIIQEVSAREYQGGVKGNILGNGKILVKGVYNEPVPQPEDFAPENYAPTHEDDQSSGPDDLPF